MNLFRCTPDRSLDRVYLRTCAIYRLLKHHRIGYQRARELALLPIKRHPHGNPALLGTIDIWRKQALNDMLP